MGCPPYEGGFLQFTIRLLVREEDDFGDAGLVFQVEDRLVSKLSHQFLIRDCLKNWGTRGRCKGRFRSWLARGENRSGDCEAQSGDKACLSAHATATGMGGGSVRELFTIGVTQGVRQKFFFFIHGVGEQ